MLLIFIMSVTMSDFFGRSAFFRAWPGILLGREGRGLTLPGRAGPPLHPSNAGENRLRTFSEKYPERFFSLFPTHPMRQNTVGTDPPEHALADGGRVLPLLQATPHTGRERGWGCGGHPIDLRSNRPEFESGAQKNTK